MSEWRGLHNPERHEACPWESDEAACSDSSCKHGGCYREWPCRCCLAAEVERLTERVRVLEVERALSHEASYAKTQRLRDTLAEIERLQGRITEALTECDCIEDDGDFHGDALIAVARVASILRGESGE